MRFAAYLLNPHVIGLIALFLSIVWMLRDERDKTRPGLVIALVINLVYGSLLNMVMGKENGLVPWKYDHVLAALDASLGLNTPAIASFLQGGLRLVLAGVYDLMIPMMIVWYFAGRHRNESGSIVRAYIAEMLAGPLLYAMVPACGPIYAFRAAWLHPPAGKVELIRLSGMPNAFPSLHLGTAVVFVFFSRTPGWRWSSLAMLTGTALATLSTGEHYAIDLVAGVAFGCFAAYAGQKRPVSAASFLAIAACWSIAVRFRFGFLIDHPSILRACAAITVLVGLGAVARDWRSPAAKPDTEIFEDLGGACTLQESFTHSGK
jgi:hypothetical protein